MLVSGVDVGSTQTKAVILNENGEIIARAIINTGANVVKAAEKVFQMARASAQVDEWDMAYTVGTGYGRYKVTFGDAQITEISCHARGAFYLFPNTRTILDIGGQDTKGIKLSEKGEVADFCMNDKCAAGTGRFLEVILARLHVPIEEVAAYAARAGAPVTVSSTCTVFAESEVISLVAEGRPAEGIVRGLHLALASRVAALARGRLAAGPVLASGGVALNAAMIAALSETLGRPVRVLPEPQLVGALGAALSVAGR